MCKFTRKQRNFIQRAIKLNDEFVSADLKDNKYHITQLAINQLGLLEGVIIHTTWGDICDLIQEIFTNDW